MENPSVAVRLVSHASVILEFGDVRILTDPWTVGTAFNDSWKLIAPAAELAPYLMGVDYLWISHEHPDHFHIPTLKSMPTEFKRRVTVLFQKSSDHNKMINALNKMLGYPNVQLLPHRRWVPLRDGVEVYCYQSRQIDSALGVRGHGRTILNLNDCELSSQDLRFLRRDLGKIDVLLNQFSIAGFDGVEEKLPGEASQILDTMVRDHRALGASTTIPFASFIYFCCNDNKVINNYANSPGRVADRFGREGLDVAVLAPGDRLAIGEPRDNGPALDYYAAIYDSFDALSFGEAPRIEFDTLGTEFHKLREKLVDMHGRLALRLLKPVLIHIPDLDLVVRMSFRENTLVQTEGEADLEIYSQPLFFMLSNNFGLQTLGVSGRYRLKKGFKNWFRHRALLALLNAGLGLSIRNLLSPRQLSFFWSRRRELAGQIRYRSAIASRGIST
jgi:UDP-MurNAc hydroxylase